MLQKYMFEQGLLLHLSDSDATNIEDAEEGLFDVQTIKQLYGVPVVFIYTSFPRIITS